MARERDEDSKVARERDEDSQVARERDEDSQDVTAGSVIKDKNGKLVTEACYRSGRIISRNCKTKGKTANETVCAGT